MSIKGQPGANTVGIQANLTTPLDSEQFYVGNAYYMYFQQPLRNQGTYTINYKAFNAGGFGGSGSKSVTGGYAPDAAPVLNAPTVLSPTQLGLSWTEANQPANTYFNILLSNSSGGVSNESINQSGDSCTLGNLLPNTQYTVQVEAVSLVGSTSTQSAPSNSQAATTQVDPNNPPSIPAAPASLIATRTSASSASLFWANSSNNETGFTVEKSVDGGATWNTLALNAPDQTSYVDTQSDSTLNNKYQVLAGNAAGVSSPVQFTLLATPVQLTSLTVADPNSTNAVTVNSSGPAQWFIAAKSDGTATANLSAAFTPATAGAAVLWSINGSGASPSSGNFSSSPVSVSLDATTGNNLFTLTAGVDANHDGILSSNEVTRTIELDVVTVNDFTVTDAANLDNSASATASPDAPGTADVYVGQQDNNTGKVDLSADFAPVSGGPHLLYQILSGQTALASGDFSAVPAPITLTAAGNVDFVAQLAFDPAASPSWSDNPTVLSTVNIHLVPSVTVTASPAVVTGTGNLVGSPTDPSGLQSFFTFTRHGYVPGDVSVNMSFTVASSTAVLGRDYIFDTDKPANSGDPLPSSAFEETRTVSVGSSGTTLAVDWLKGADTSVDLTVTVDLLDGLAGSTASGSGNTTPPAIAGAPSTAASTKPAPLPTSGISLTAYRAYVPTLGGSQVTNTEKANGLGIRKDPAASRSPNNLIKVDLQSFDTGATFDLTRSNANIDVFDNAVDVANNLGAAELGDQTGQNQSANFTIGSNGKGNKTVWVEWTGKDPQNAGTDTLTFEEHLNGNVITSSIKFFPFTSLIVMYAGHQQSSTSKTDFGAEPTPVGGTLDATAFNYADKTSGTHQRALDLYKAGYDVLPLAEDPGNVGVPILHIPPVIDEHKCGNGLQTGEAAIQGAATRSVSHIALIGYSHGGGLVDDTSKWMSANMGTLHVDVPYSAYIDGIVNPHTWANTAQPLTEIPSVTAYHANYFESFVGGADALIPAYPHGLPMDMHDPRYNVLHEHADYDDTTVMPHVDVATHSSIDQDLDVHGHSLRLNSEIETAIKQAVHLPK